MDEPGHKPLPPLSAVPNLAEALRRARVEAAEQSQVVADLRNGEVARLDMLREAIRPLMAQVPDDVDLFDVGVLPGSRPRLFIDMIGFVEMARDKRTYRFLQDTRHGRLTLCESERVDEVTNAVANYVARRLIEREKALAADISVEEAAQRLAAPPAPVEPQPVAAAGSAPAPIERPGRPRGAFETALLFVIQFLGAATLTLLIAAAAWTLWRLLTGAEG